MSPVVNTADLKATDLRTFKNVHSFCGRCLNCSRWSWDAVSLCCVHGLCKCLYVPLNVHLHVNAHGAHACLRVFVSPCSCLRVHMHMHTCACTHVCVYTCVLMCHSPPRAHFGVWVCLYTLHMGIHVCASTYAHICVYTCMCAFMHLCTDVSLGVDSHLSHSLIAKAPSTTQRTRISIIHCLKTPQEAIYGASE